MVLTHLEKYESQWEGLSGLSHILWKIKMFETTNQPWFETVKTGDFTKGLGNSSNIWIFYTTKPLNVVNANEI